MTLFDGISARVIDTPRLRVGILERDTDDAATPPERTVVLVHGNVSSAMFWQEIMQDLPSDLRVIAVDLRGFGGSEHAPVDATRGLRDYSDDVFATLEALGLETAHLVGWSMGGGVVMQYALDHPTLSLTLQAPVSPYGFGGTRRDGSRLTDDDAGCGGGSEHAPVDATRGLRDYSDDVFATLEALGLETAHLVGWSMGGGVVMQYALDHPTLSLTLQAPVSPYGFGGTRRDGSRLTDDDAGCGGGGANPDFVARLAAADTTDEAQTSPRSVFRSGYVGSGYTTDHEDVWVASMLTTSTAEGNYPGDGVPSDNWPGFAAGTTGVLNTMSPKYHDVSGIVDLETKPPILWVHGSVDAIVSDTSFYDLNHLGALGIVPGWPGADVAPAQEMVSQTRDVLGAYTAAGGQVTEVNFEGVGHSPHLERPAEFRRVLLELIGYVGRPADPAPPTEAIILKSAD